ncbi:MAG: PIN domain-containing protein [bacterium]
MKFFLIDGSSFLYRAYYAFPSMNDQDGHNINVVYGFFRMLMKIFQEKPDYFVITWDSPVKTLRHEEYTEYKANRKKMDDDFKHQIPITQAIVEQL